MGVGADFYTATNQWIAPNATVDFHYWWNNNRPNEYMDVTIMPVATASLPEVGRETHNSNGGVALTLSIKNAENYWVQFDANYIRIPSQS